MKTVICFGDSNTHGYIPDGWGARYPKNQRWPGVLQKLLGEEYDVVEAGLNGRTIAVCDGLEPYCSARQYLLPCLMTHKPFDLLILMLGSNDTKRRFGLGAGDIAKAMRELLHEALDYIRWQDFQAKILLIAPVAVQPNDGFGFDETSAKVSRALEGQYMQLALECGAAYLNAGLYAAPAGSDGVHLTVEGHEALGRAVAEKVRSLLA